MSAPSKSSGSTSPSSTAPSLEVAPMDHGLTSPGIADDYDDIYVEEVVPDSPTTSEATVPDRKGKGKARQRSQSRTPRSERALKDDPDLRDVQMAKQAYLSPPLTASDNFLLSVQNISRALRRGLSSIDFDVDLDLQSGSEESSPSSPGGHISPSSTINGHEEDVEDSEAVVGVAVSALDWEESSILSPSSPSEAESSRKATAGDTTLQDAGSMLPAVRFPSIFTQDMDMSLESSEAGTPLSFPLAVSSPIIFGDVVHPWRRDEDEGAVSIEPSGVLAHRRQSVGEVGVKTKRRRVWRRRRLRIQEKGLTRDFLLILTLCFGLACAGILIIRPTIMALYGYDRLGGRLDVDFD